MVATIRLFVTVGKGTLAPWNPTQKLVVQGVYRHVRNPMISGVMFILAGRGGPGGVFAAADLVRRLRGRQRRLHPADRGARAGEAVRRGVPGVQAERAEMDSEGEGGIMRHRCPKSVTCQVTYTHATQQTQKRQVAASPYTCGYLLSARTTGLEPATTGSTVRYSNQLSYVPKVFSFWALRRVLGVASLLDNRETQNTTTFKKRAVCPEQPPW